MPIYTTQHKFVSGELDPKLLGRSDIDRYYGAAATMTNVRLLPHGGFRKDDGLAYQDPLLSTDSRQTANITTPNGGTGANANDNNTATELVTTTNISTTNPYVVVHYDLLTAIDISFIDIVGAKLTSATNNGEFFIQVSTDDITWSSVGGSIRMSTSDVTQRRRVNGSYRYVRFARIGTTDLSTDKVTLDEFHVWSNGTPSTSKLIPFEFSTTQRYMLLLTAGNIAVYRSDGYYFADVRATRLTAAIIAQIDATQSGDTMIFVEEDLIPIKLVRSGDNQWLVSDLSFTKTPFYDFTPVLTTSPGAGTLTPSAVSGSITLTVSAGTPFSSASVDQYLQGGGGRARIVEYISTTVVRAVTEIPFFSTTAIANGDWDYLTGFEAVWSPTRGYPRTVTFFQGRLYFGGAKSRPTTIWASKIDVFFDFDLGTLSDSDGIEATLDTDQLNTITSLKAAGGNLTIFTTGAEFVIPASSNNGITPSNFTFVPVSQYGSHITEPAGEEDIRLNAVTIGTQTLFVQRGGKSVIRHVYDTLQQVSENENITLLASHLISAPLDFASRRSSSTEENDLLLIINEDGELIEGTIIFQQNVVGFTRRIASPNGTGVFRNVGVIDSTIFTVVRRIADGTFYYTLELLDDERLLDSSVVYSPNDQTTVTGLERLEGQTVYGIHTFEDAIGDSNLTKVGSFLFEATVASGTVTIPADVLALPGDDVVEIGLPSNLEVITLPIEIPELGAKIGKKKRISGATLRLYDTVNIKLNDDVISFRTFGDAGAGSPLDANPVRFTGDKKIQGLLGWNDRGQITISQAKPADATILSITMSVNI
jgi:hypothetical protein